MSEQFISQYDTKNVREGNGAYPFKLKDEDTGFGQHTAWQEEYKKRTIEALKKRQQQEVDELEAALNEVFKDHPVPVHIKELEAENYRLRKERDEFYKNRTSYKDGFYQLSDDDKSIIDNTGLSWAAGFFLEGERKLEKWESDEDIARSDSDRVYILDPSLNIIDMVHRKSDVGEWLRRNSSFNKGFSRMIIYSYIAKEELYKNSYYFVPVKEYEKFIKNKLK